MWMLRVSYKDKNTKNVTTRDLMYYGEKDKKNPKWVEDADKLAFSDCREDEDVMGYELIEKHFTHILISVINSDSTNICTQFFYSLEEAQEQMLWEVADTGGCDTIEQLKEKYLEDGDFGYNDFSAWSNCEFDSNYHWKIEEIDN